MRTPLLSLVAGASIEAEGLPPTDEVHAFLDLLEQLARMDG